MLKLGAFVHTKYLLKFRYLNLYVYRSVKSACKDSQLCAEPRHFCKLDMTPSRMAFLDLNLYVLEVATSNSNN